MKPVILGISGPALMPEERDLFLAHRPRGVILFGRNIVDPAQLATLMAQLREALPPGAVLMVDQEGGRVARLKPPHWPALPPAGSLRTAEEAFAHGRALGVMVREAGFTMTAAPVLDLRVPGASDVVGDRAITGDPETVAALGGEIARGIMAEGITPVMKHIPGHGRALVDSHVSLPRVPELTNDDLLPFIRNKHLPWAMTAHVVYESIDPARPGTLSPIVIREIIRGKIGFTGTLVSDDLAMGALSGATPAERALAALAAGCDIALYCPGDMEGNRAVLEALA
ncbi:beta-N-acetylhexosaminidase [Acidocella aromatica]|uniref:beta-N-acetylhexosaminidase n=1 Tax=Acidocella aromatica TaxID=1303579 RepID=A0A840VF10_9PROT|nr:beta-N-acetylhexosaminidase [Acidocella aromatica]MBB5371815.1 beta-N-acetylhexosaminidase [Acidocella aromatica]